MRLGLASVAMLSVLVTGCGDDKGNVTAPPGGKKVEAVAPPAGKDWTQVVSETPEGGFRMGNPNAVVKILEHGSFGCPHCAAFAADAAGPLGEYVKSGRVSWEFRSHLIFPADPAISMLTRCHGADAFFLLMEQLYASQPEWEGKLQSAPPTIDSLPPEQRLKAIVQAAGLDVFFRQRGMPQTKIDSCLADKAGLARTLEVHQNGADDVQRNGGTPAFLLNGTSLPSMDQWAKLEPYVKTALGE